MTSPSSTSREGGFTLMEMMVVIAVMSVILLLITSYGPPHSRRLETQAAVQEVADAMRIARGQAISQGHQVAFSPPSLPDGINAIVEAPGGRILFAPDGSANGGRVLLQNGGQNIAVSADWLTGQVQVDAN